MKKLERQEMKNLKGGVNAPPSGGWCRATAFCGVNSSGQNVYTTLTCEDSTAGCVAVDYGAEGNSGHGYAYCQHQNGTLEFSSCQ